jgi:hypothetical protein
MLESYLTRLARIGGPACVAVAIWCAAGQVSVVAAVGFGQHIVAPAPWWMLVAGAVIGWLVPGWRRSPVTALPAALTILPWLPIPLPAVGLIWTGPMAWVPVLAALAAAVGSRPLGSLARRVCADDHRQAPWLAAGLTVCLCLATLWSLQPRLPGGDEPHYLVITQSLLRDGDLRIENNHTDRDYAAYYPGTLRPDYINRGQDGQIYSIHAPGVSALVLPGFAIFGLLGAQLTIILCLAVTAFIVWRTCYRATEDVAAAWFAWAAVFGSATALLLGVMVFPDSPAALGTAAVVWLLVRLASNSCDVRARAFFGVGSALAVMPWLHTRFAVIAGLGGLAVVVAVAASRGLPWRERVMRLAAFLSVPVVSAMAWLLSFWMIYGTWDPRAPYRGAESIRDWIWGSVVGLYADQQFGLFAFAPVMAAAFVGACRAADRSLRRVCLVTGSMLAVYTMAVTSYHMWWAGLPGLPARFLTAVLPLLAVPLAVGWHRATSVGRTALLTMLAASWAITALVIGFDHGVFAFNYRDGQAAWLEWLNRVVNLPRAWPSFFWGTQGAFLTHVGAFLAVWGVGWGIARVVARRYADRADVGRVGVVAWVLFGLMAGAEVGWRLNGVTGLDPARSQLSVLAADQLWGIGPLSVSKFDPASLVIRPDESPLSDRPSPVVMAVGPISAGVYRLELALDEARTDPVDAVVRIGRSREALTQVRLAPGETAAVPLPLPLGAASLVVEVAEPEATRHVGAGLRPMSVSRDVDARARTFVRRDAVETWFADDSAFVEPDGFWVRGGQQTTVAWTGGASAAGRSRTLVVRNGGARNEVSVQMDGWSQTLSLAEWEEQVVTLPAANAAGAWVVQIRSASGFRPSDTSGDDRRYLGVWIPFN